MSRLYSVVDDDALRTEPTTQAAAGRRPSRLRQQRAEAEMLDALAIYLDLAMVSERMRTDRGRCTGGQSC
jgi:hypothetical protein